VKNSQKGIISNLADKIFRLTDSAVISNIFEAIDSWKTKITLDKVDYNMADTDSMAAGWFYQPLIDMICVYDLCAVVRFQSHGVELPEHVLRTSICLAGAPQVISPRLRSFFRPIQGPGDQYARKAWTYITRLFEASKSAKEIVAKFNAEDLENIVCALEEAVKLEKKSKVYNAVVKHIIESERNKELLVSLAKYSASGTVDPDDKLLDISGRVHKAIHACVRIGYELKGDSCIADIVDGELVHKDPTEQVSIDGLLWIHGLLEILLEYTNTHREVSITHPMVNQFYICMYIYITN